MDKLSPTDAQFRLKAVRGIMRTEGLDGLLVTDLADVRYLCGYEHEGLQLFVTRRGAYLTTRHRGIQRARTHSVGFRIIDPAESPGGFGELVKKRHLAMVGVNGRMSHNPFVAIRKQMRPARLKLSTAVFDARAVKSPAEIALLRKAQRQAEKIFDALIAEIQPGMTEHHVHNRILQLIYANDSLEGPSFPPVVCAGDSSWTFHSRYTDRKLRKNDCIIIDMGVRYRGYCSDMTRTVFLGKPTRRMRDVYQIVGEAQRRAIETIRADVPGSDVSDAAWGFIASEGYERTHGLGHGVGLETHDSPIPAMGKNPMRANNVVTVEPGIYLENAFGVRIEDTVIVTPDGCENITRTSKELTIIG